MKSPPIGGPVKRVIPFHFFFVLWRRPGLDNAGRGSTALSQARTVLGAHFLKYAAISGILSIPSMDMRGWLVHILPAIQ
jgi:hypothetical protein